MMSEQHPTNPEDIAPTTDRRAAPAQSRAMPRSHGYLIRRPRNRPWYNQGWVWLLIAAIVLTVVVWQLSGLGEAVRSTAAATREQTMAIQEQTETMKEQGHWLQQQLEEIGRALNSLAQGAQELLNMARSMLGN